MGGTHRYPPTIHFIHFFIGFSIRIFHTPSSWGIHKPCQALRARTHQGEVWAALWAWRPAWILTLIFDHGYWWLLMFTVYIDGINWWWCKHGCLYIDDVKMAVHWCLYIDVHGCFYILMVYWCSLDLRWLLLRQYTFLGGGWPDRWKLEAGGFRVPQRIGFIIPMETCDRSN